MANYTTADVKKLRELTAAGMMDCKKALDEADGDFDKAVEILRIKGAKDVGKRAERTTSNGLVAVKDGAMVELRCETDFVAKNADFVALAEEIAAIAKANKTADVEALKAVEVDGKTVDALVQEFSAKIGEKLELAKAVDFDGTVSTYLHKRAADLPPAVGVLVEYTGDDAEAAKGAAMQIVANERRIAEETAREEGKPEGALPKIVEGRVNGFFKDVVLLEQASVTDSKKTVKALLDEAGVTVTRFARFEVGQS